MAICKDVREQDASPYQRCRAYGFETSEGGNPPTRHYYTRQGMLARKAGKKSHGTSLREATQYDAIGRGAGVNLRQQDFSEGMHAVEKILFVVSVCARGELRVLDVEPTKRLVSSRTWNALTRHGSTDILFCSLLHLFPLKRMLSRCGVVCRPANTYSCGRIHLMCESPGSSLDLFAIGVQS